MINTHLVKKLVELQSGIKDLGIKSRKRYIVDVRYAYFKLCRTYIKKISLEKIGNSVNRDHSLVTHGIKQFDNLIGLEFYLANDVFNSVNARLKELQGHELDDMLLNVDDICKINQYHRIRYINLVEKSHSVISIYIKKYKELEKKLAMVDYETINAVETLTVNDFKEFQARNKLFIKVKTHINKSV